MFNPHQFYMPLLGRVLVESRCVCVETLGCRESTGGSAGPDSGQHGQTAGTPKMSAHRVPDKMSL